MKQDIDWLAALASLKAGMPDDTAVHDEEPEHNAPAKKTTRRKLSLFIEKKGRGGKTATIITGFSDDDDIEKIAARLKKQLGTGGSARGGEILIQGDRRADIAEILKDDFRFN